MKRSESSFLEGRVIGVVSTAYSVVVVLEVAMCPIKKEATHHSL